MSDVNCRNYVNCGGFALENHEYCEHCIEEQDEIAEQLAKETAAINELKRAVEFFEQVQNAPSEERMGVRSDHYDWLISSAKKVANTF